MDMNFRFLLNAVMLGVGLSMDAFSVAVADGVAEPFMSRKKALLIAFVFALFQGVMPLLGWGLFNTVLGYFEISAKFVPFFAAALLMFLGVKMIFEKGGNTITESGNVLVMSALFMQGLATSLDAMSAGISVCSYSFSFALLTSLLISLVTFSICNFGVEIGKKAGGYLSKFAHIIGGVLLFLIGIEILIGSVI